MRPTRRSHRTFALLTLAVAIGLLGGVAALNATVDPFKVWRPNAVEKLDPYKRLTMTRIVRAAQVHRGDWQVVLAGASRTEIGLDPDCPALAGKRAVNIGLSGAHFPEIMASADYALAQNPGLQTLVVEMDPAYLDMAYGDPEDFRMSLFNPGRSLAEYRLASLTGGLFIERSAQTLGDFFAKKPAHVFTPNGLRIDYRVYLSRGVRDFFRKGIGEVAQWRPDYWPAGRNLNLDLMPPIKDLALRCQARGVRLEWVIPPAHAARLCVDVRRGDWAATVAYKRALAKMVDEVNQGQPTPTLRVWDFFVPRAENLEEIPAADGVPMAWHWEPGHFKKALGDKVLERLFGATTADAATPGSFGHLLTPESIEPHLNAVNRDLAAYIGAHPGLDGFLPTDGVAEHAGQTPVK